MEDGKLKVLVTKELLFVRQHNQMQLLLPETLQLTKAQRLLSIELMVRLEIKTHMEKIRFHQEVKSVNSRVVLCMKYKGRALSTV